MASGFFAILDDISALMDDVAVNSKIATQKTAGILGDDLAVNAEKATGFNSSREVPVLIKIMKGSFVNKLIIVPFVFLLEWLYSPVIKIILIIGGFYLAYEGVEKIVEFLFHSNHKQDKVVEKLPKSQEEKDVAEKAKVKAAITTDFILSLEIVIIALAASKSGYEVLKSEFNPFLVEIFTVSITSILATIGVYGIVALIVRMDDAGFKLIQKTNDKGFFAKLGHVLVKALPFVIKAFGVIGTIALILVAGGIFEENIHWFHHALPDGYEILKKIIFGLAGGLIALFLITGGKKIYSLVTKN